MTEHHEPGPPGGELTCRAFTDFLADYLSGELPAAQRALFEEHLAECPDCVAYLKTYRQAVELGKRACAHPDDAPPAEAPEELVRAILAAVGRGNSSPE